MHKDMHNFMIHSMLMHRENLIKCYLNLIYHVKNENIDIKNEKLIENSELFMHYCIYTRILNTFSDQ